MEPESTLLRDPPVARRGYVAELIAIEAHARKPVELAIALDSPCFMGLGLGLTLNPKLLNPKP